MREHSREPRPGPPRDHEDERYRGGEGREKDSRDAHYRYSRGPMFTFTYHEHK